MPNRIIDVYWEIVAVKTDWLAVLQHITKWLAIGVILGYYIGYIVKGG